MSINPIGQGVVHRGLSFSAFASILLMSILFCGFVVGQDIQEDWPKFLGPRGDGTSLETGILKDWSGGKLKLNWQIPVGEGYAPGTVSEGAYFHFDVKTKPEGTVARLRSIDLETSETRWQFTYPSSYRDLYGYDSGPRTSPIVSEGQVFVFGVEGMLHCVNAKDGTEIWKLDTSKRFGVVQNFFGVSSCPVLHKDLLITMIGGSPAASQKLPPGRLDLVKPNGSAIVALNRHSGDVVYEIGDDLASYSSLRIVAIHGEQVALAWLRESLIGFRPDDGKILFEFPWRAKKLESVNASTPVVVGNRIFLGECYEMGGVMLDIKKVADSERKLAWTAESLWEDTAKREKSMATHWNTPVVHRGNLYGCSGRHEGSAKLNCVDIETGKLRWSVPRLGRTSITLCDDHLIVMSERGKLSLVKATPENYELVTEYDGDVRFRSPCWAAPIVAQGKLIVRGRDKVACFELK